MINEKHIEITNRLVETVDEKLREHYGKNQDEIIKKRVKDELNAMKHSESVMDVAFLYEISRYLKEKSYPWCLRGCTGSSFILYLLGVSKGNPLPPHLYCPKCHDVLWKDCKDGFDLENAICSDDQHLLTKDGHNIPWQSLWGYGKFMPSFDMDLPESLFETFEDILKSERFSKYDELFKVDIPYPGKVKQIKLGKISLLFNLKLDNVSDEFYLPSNQDIDVKKLLYRWHEVAEIEEHENLPEPKDFADLCSLFRLLHSTGTWDEWSKMQLEEDRFNYSDLVSDREAVFHYLTCHGFLDKDAWKGMREVQLGHKLSTVTEEMKDANDSWIMDRCSRIKYLFPKAHAVERILFNAKIL